MSWKTKDGFNPPIYRCGRAKRPFTLDGNLDKEFWEDAEFTEPFADIEGDGMPKPRFGTRAKMLWDDENLYVGAVLEGDEIWGHQTERDCVIFRDNDFEIFIDPDSDTQQYYEFEMNAKNTVWDLLLTKAYRDGGRPVNGYDMHGMKSAVKIDGVLNDPSAENKRWSVEVVIPFSAIWECSDHGRAPKPGEYYRMNFSRVQWKVDVVNGEYVKRQDKNGRTLPEDNWVWAPTGVVNIHCPEHWGFVFFTDGDENYSIPESEYLKWELRKLYYALHDFRDENGRYPDSLDEIHNTPTEIKVNYAKTPHTFELSCQTEDKTEIVLLSDGKVYCTPVEN